MGLSLRGVRYRYPDGRVALDGVDLAVASGDRVAVLGPNGAGKTTLVLHLNGVLAPQEGQVLVDGLDTAEKADVREVRRRVGVVFQDPDDQLFCPTVRQDVAFGPANLGLDGDEVDERVAGALDAVGMGHAVDRAPYHLSPGERRRVAVATVLAMHPTTLVLDEPSANLDPAARSELAAVIRSLPELTLVVVTHDLPYALELCPRSVVLDAGRVVDEAPTPELLADPERLAAHRLALPHGLRLA